MSRLDDNNINTGTLIYVAYFATAASKLFLGVSGVVARAFALAVYTHSARARISKQPPRVLAKPFAALHQGFILAPSDSIHRDQATKPRLPILGGMRVFKKRHSGEQAQRSASKQCRTGFSFAGFFSNSKQGLDIISAVGSQVVVHSLPRPGTEKKYLHVHTPTL
ncbi:hypothetical protein C8J57DRAFT_1468186 [Mycena rebaudengoi]|nr:hypothetical protein C8J57DRAFT_1468186 [Mycena rebaudengoi]